MATDLSNITSVIYLGIVEGLTEFIPVSSTGHLVLFSRVIDLAGPKVKTFEIFIQLGAILAVVVLYHRRFRALLTPTNDARFAGRTGCAKLILACIPAFILGALFHEVIKSELMTAVPVALGLILGGIMLAAVESRKTPRETIELDMVTYRQALLVGVFQCMALWPGMSRSGSTIIGGLLAGMDRRVAAEFSFLVAVPVMLAAASYDLWQSRSILEPADVTTFGLGFVVAFVTAVAAIKFFLALLARFKLTVFAIYRILLGVFVLCIA